MFGKDTRASIQNLKDQIRFHIYYGESSEIYTLEYNEFDDTPTENIPLIQAMDSFILNYDENQSVVKFFVNYKLSEEEIENGRIQELNDLAYPNIKFLTDLEEFTGIGDGNVLCGIIYKIICRFQDKNHKINGKFIWEYLNDPKVETTQKYKTVYFESCLERANRLEVLFAERKAAQERIRTLISEVSSNLKECPFCDKDHKGQNRFCSHNCGETEDNDNFARDCKKEDLTCPVCKKDHNEQIQYNFCSYGCGTVYCSCWNQYHTIDGMSIRGHNPKCGYIEDNGIDSFETVMHPSTIFKESDLKSHDICPGCNKNNDKEHLTICNNGCGTAWCDCGQEYHIANDKCLPDHAPNCGEDSDHDSVKEYREATELHTKIISDFFSRKRIFRDRFNSDSIITKMSLPEDVKERIFAKFDDLSDRFTDKYGGARSFLPYQYIFFKLFLEEGYEYPLFEEGYKYPYRYTEAKYKAMEKLYWSVKDPKDYSNFINFLKSPTECENFEIYDSPKKVVIQRSLSRGNTTAYVLKVKGTFDLALQYFTKVLPKSGKNPEYRYNLFILEMKDKLKLETISLNDVINYMISYVINELMYFAEEL
jgi:hypothetical protein